MKSNFYYQSFIINDKGRVFYTGLLGSGDKEKCNQWLATNALIEGMRDEDNQGQWILVVLEEMDDGTFRSYY